PRARLSQQGNSFAAPHFERHVAKGVHRCLSLAVGLGQTDCTNGARLGISHERCSDQSRGTTRPIAMGARWSMPVLDFQRYPLGRPWASTSNQSVPCPMPDRSVFVRWSCAWPCNVESKILTRKRSGDSWVGFSAISIT